VLDRQLWSNVWEGLRPRAWDGTGHYALAQIYDQSIFPDTFGWTHAYFAGMPFPNFYPPLFYWCVALLHHTHLISFAAAFKLVLALPVILLPAAVLVLAWVASDKNRTAATCAALAIISLLVDKRFYYPLGLSHASTFLVGLYTHPLGFGLLAVWYITYLNSHRRHWQFISASLLLSLVILANFFGAITAALFIAATVAHDLMKYYGAADSNGREETRRALIAHLISPIVGALLASFWLVPMLTASDYFVTRPQAVPFHELVPPIMFVWYALSIIGMLCWLRRPTAAMWPFLLTAVALASGIVFAAILSPRWFPLQTPRFLSTLNFLLAVPVGLALSTGWHKLMGVIPGKATSRGKQFSDRLKKSRNGGTPFRGLAAPGIAITLLVGMLILLKPPSYGLAFFATTDGERIDGVLRFAREHRDGRYLVEVPEFSRSGPSLDSRALNSYLGAQGNEALSVVFREASPNSLFFNPQASALSAYPDNYGISSALAGDLDFAGQPTAKHLERARLAGAKYLVIFSPTVRERLSHEQSVKAVYDSSGWAIFEMQSDPLPQIRALLFRPALVVSKFSLKLRRRDEYNFIRLAEEQFADGWFDVLLVRSTESKIDRIRGLDRFGALILDTYECDDENAAFERLRDFSRDHPLILLSSDAPLFRHIRDAVVGSPLIEIIERSPEPSGEWLEATAPAFRYGSSSIRKQWQVIRQALDGHKTATGTPATTFSGEISQNAIRIEEGANRLETSTPVLIETTDHPNWRREDGDDIYAATPFFMLTFVSEPTRIVYARGPFDKIALFGSAVAFFCLCAFTGWHYRKRPLTTER
jgi:hypothetical protein